MQFQTQETHISMITVDKQSIPYLLSGLAALNEKQGVTLQQSAEILQHYTSIKKAIEDFEKGTITSPPLSSPTKPEL